MKQDIILFGGMAGVISNIPKEILTWFLYLMGWIPFTFDHFCAAIYVSPAYVHGAWGLFLGIMVDFTQAGIFGAAILYILKKTGLTHQWFLKSVVFGFGMFFICFGVLRPMISPQIMIATPLQNLLYLPPNVLYTIATVWFIHRSSVLENKW